jgi:hypothetical protein
MIMNCLQSVFRLGALVVLLLGGWVAHGQTITTITNTTSGHGLNGLAWGGMVGNQVTIYGSGFTAVSSVKFGGVNAITFGATESTKIVATIPSGALSGIVSVTFTAGGTITSPQSFTVIPTGPYVRSFSPVAGNSNTTVIIKGAVLQGFTAVRFNGVNARSASYGPNANEITALPPVGVTTGPISVITNSFTHNTTSNFFAEPILTGFSPSFGRSGTNVIITGTNLAGVTEVLFNGASSPFQTNHNGQVTATLPVGATTGRITVFGPGGSVQSSSNFVVRPTIFGFAPNVGRAGTNVTITGANLNEGVGGTPVVRFGTNTASVSGVSFGQVTATVPNGAVTSLISVTTTNGSHTNDALFYLPPRITTFSSSNAPVSTAITINGTNFLGTSAVLFNGVPASFFNVSNFSLQVVVPAGFVTGPVTITTPAGTTNSPGLFYAAPTISSFSPSHGLPGTNVLIIGSSFTNASAVAFGGVAATSFTVLSNSGVRATVPVGALSGLVSVTAPAGTAFSASPFTLNSDIPVPALDFNVSGGSIQLAWPTNLIPFTLQATTNVAAAATWTSILTAPTTVGNSNVITEPMTGAEKYYRLKK